MDPCNCTSGRFKRFVDFLTLIEQHVLSPIGHVRTTDLAIIQNKILRENRQKGLNHIPLEATWFNEVIFEIITTWEQLSLKFDLLEELTLRGIR